MGAWDEGDLWMKLDQETIANRDGMEGFATL